MSCKRENLRMNIYVKEMTNQNMMFRSPRTHCCMYRWKSLLCWRTLHLCDSYVFQVYIRHFLQRNFLWGTSLQNEFVKKRFRENKSFILDGARKCVITKTHLSTLFRSQQNRFYKHMWKNLQCWYKLHLSDNYGLRVCIRYCLKKIVIWIICDAQHIRVFVIFYWRIKDISLKIKIRLK